MQTVMVTGAAGGIGRELVERAREKGDLVFAVARSLAQLREMGGDRVLPVVMDVSDSQSVAAGFAEVDRLLEGRPLDAVIHCAAVAPLGTVEFTSPDEYARVLNINTLGALRIAQGSVNRMRAHGGRLIFVSSLWGRLSGPLVSSYSASKHAVEAIADALRRETAGSGIKISVVEPGVVKTKMFTGQTAEVTAKIESLGEGERSHYLWLYQAYLKLFERSARTAITAEACADAIMNVLNAKRPRTRYLVGPDAKLLVRLADWLPDRGLDELFRKMI